jgi:hypothetical protein
MKKEELDKQFKDAASKLRVVFVCAMWLTGFDVKTLSCLHIDKPIHLPSIHIFHQFTSYINDLVNHAIAQSRRR